VAALDSLVAAAAAEAAALIDVAVLDIVAHAEPVHTNIVLEVELKYRAPVKRVSPSLSTLGSVAF
tara:strand:+ start:1656 stop:1850 length:195 start_codon:yes stop_codon:yes gene_type:complete